MNWMRNWLRGGRRADPVQGLRMRLDRFRELLDRNNRVLELIADAGEKLSGDYLFDIQYLRSIEADLADAARVVVQNLADMTGNRYPGLREALYRTREAVRASLESRVVVRDGPPVVGLEEAGVELAGLVGEKMARLGELGRHGLRVPDGFVITAAACKLLLEDERIAGRIDVLRAGAGDLAEAGREVEEAIRGATPPSAVRKAIRRALREYDRDATFAVRSSALGEDGELSFAGQYETVLNVSADELPSAWLRVIASLFGARALRYRERHGLPLSEGAMAVGCQRMVPAAASGVAYSLDPAAPERDALIVTAALGLGVMVVEGEGTVDRFVVSRTPPHPVLGREVTTKGEMYAAAPAGGVELTPVPPERQGEPALGDEILVELAEAALRIERQLKRPVDLEWAVDTDGRLLVLQARPLEVTATRAGRGAEIQEALRRYPVLMKGEGEVACRGIGAGKVVLVGHGQEPERLEPGSVLVARYSSPRLSGLVSSAAAVVTDVGAATGHLATIAREYRVPTIVDTARATTLLEPGMEITVDAEENIVYQGIAEELLRYDLLQGDSYGDAPEFRVLRAMLKSIAPLNLRDPSSPEFRAEECRTYHDIIRFAHEKAITELSELRGLEIGRHGAHLHRLELEIPIDLVMIDAGGAFRTPRAGAPVRPEEVEGEPLRALLEGLTEPGVWQNRPADMDLGGFLSSATRSIGLTLPGAEVERNLAIVSRDYMNLSLKLGYHFNVVDCFMGEGEEESYILFRFIGGVTDLARRTRRARVLSDILSYHDFVVDRKGELVMGRLAGVSRPLLEERLRMVGRLIGFSRQLDIHLRDDEIGNRLVAEFLAGGSDEAIEGKQED